MALAAGQPGVATIEVARRTLVQHNARRYLVFIDDAPVGSLWAFQTGRYTVRSGWHEVRLSISGTTTESDTVAVDVPACSVRRLRTRGRRGAFFAIPPALVRQARGTSAPDSRPWIVLTVDQ